MPPGVLPSEAALTCSTGAYGHSVSEHLFALLLALMKRLPSYRDQQNRALWRDLGPVKTLLGAQVLVVGTGDLGSSFARLCQTLGASTSGVRRDPAKPAAGIERMYGFEALDTLLPAADVVALTLPQTPGTVRLFDKARLLRMKGDAILLNGGRGSCVDGQALAEVLADGRLVGRGPGCHRPGAPSAGASAVAQPRALITPHTAGGNHLADTERRIARIALDNLRRYLAGEALRNRVR
ncbi:MAG: NAD(P)-dependent oxidoreductase [Flavonifractor plautii]